MVANVKVYFFWDVTPYSLVERYHRLEEPCISIFTVEESSGTSTFKKETIYSPETMVPSSQNKWLHVSEQSNIEFLHGIYFYAGHGSRAV
jgi:hypothetical protein